MDPALGENSPVTRIKTENQPWTEASGPRRREGGRLRGGGAHDHPGYAPLQGGLDLRRVARPATRLHRHSGGGHDVRDQIEVAPVAPTRAIEVHHVEPWGTSVCETRRKRDRIRTEIGHAGEIALFQPHRVPIEQVDRGDDQHATLTPTRHPVIVLAY